MATTKLTKRFVDDTQQEAKDSYHWDTDVPGLGLKVTPKGRKVFLLQYRRPGGRTKNTTKFTLGQYGIITVAQARDMARRYLADIVNGIDPAAEKRKGKDLAALHRVTDVIDQFIALHVEGQRSAKETIRILKREVVPAWGNRSVLDITKSDINELLGTKVSQGSHTMANRILAAVRKLFSWCVGKDMLQHSPCDGVPTPSKETKRDRVLGDRELVTILNAARGITSPFGGIVELLIWTAQRRSEVSAMEWTELNIDKATWTIPAARSKNNKAHTVHLCDQAVALLSKIDHFGEFVFTTTGTGPFKGFSKSKKQLDNQCGITDWVLHDIRRTVVTGMAGLKVSHEVADKVLNHQTGVISSTAAVYQRHEFLDERKEAMDKWAEHVQGLIDAAGDADPVPLS
jgi:integrase